MMRVSGILHLLQNVRIVDPTFDRIGDRVVSGEVIVVKDRLPPFLDFLFFHLL